MLFRRCTAFSHEICFSSGNSLAFIGDKNATELPTLLLINSQYIPCIPQKWPKGPISLTAGSFRKAKFSNSNIVMADKWQYYHFIYCLMRLSLPWKRVHIIASLPYRTRNPLPKQQLLTKLLAHDCKVGLAFQWKRIEATLRRSLSIS